MALTAPAPGRSRGWGRSGAVFFACFCLIFAACEPRGPAVEAGDETIHLPYGTEVHAIQLTSTRGGAPIQPDTILARPGDVIRFVAADNRGYAITFSGPEMGSAQREFLERTGQLHGPPLIQREATWLVDLEGAPAGRYPFRDVARDARGVVIVEAEGG